MARLHSEDLAGLCERLIVAVCKKKDKGAKNPISHVQRVDRQGALRMLDCLVALPEDYEDVSV